MFLSYVLETIKILISPLIIQKLQKKTFCSKFVRSMDSKKTFPQHMMTKHEIRLLWLFQNLNRHLFHSDNIKRVYTLHKQDDKVQLMHSNTFFTSVHHHKLWFISIHYQFFLQLKYLVVLCFMYWNHIKTKSL